MSTIGALSLDESLGAWSLLGGLVATMLVFWLAHAYAEIVSLRVALVDRLTVADVIHVLESEWPLVQAAVPGVLAVALYRSWASTDAMSASSSRSRSEPSPSSAGAW